MCIFFLKQVLYKIYGYQVIENEIEKMRCDKCNKSIGKKISLQLDPKYKIEIIERMQLQQLKLEEKLLSKQQEIVNKNTVINQLEKNFFHEKEKSSKKIAILQKEVEEKSRTIENLKNQLDKELNRIKGDYEKEIIDLKKKT